MKLLSLVFLSLIFSQVAYANEARSQVEPVTVKQVQPNANAASANANNTHDVLRTYFLARRPYMQVKTH